jgi:hypothetical protein
MSRWGKSWSADGNDEIDAKERDEFGANLVLVFVTIGALAV